MDKKLEALKRMEKLGLLKEVIDEFKNEGEHPIYYSERLNSEYPAVLYWLDNEPNFVKLVKDFEQKNEAVVYHCILTHTAFGDLLDMLFVSNYPEDWDMDNKDIADGYVISNCVNLTDNMLSEMGSIVVKPKMGGLERIA